MRALLLSGGSAYGAVQVPVIERLMEQHGLDEYRCIFGVSVGSLNGVMAAQNQSARSIWENLRSARDFQRSMWFKGFKKGLYGFGPLQKLLKQHVAPSRIPRNLVYGCGVVDLQAERYRTVFPEGRTKASFIQGILASSAQPFIHEWQWVEFVGDGRRACVDGGLMHYVPRIPAGLLPQIHAIDVVLCTPVGRVNHEPVKDVDGILEVGMRALEIYNDKTVKHDPKWLKGMARRGTEVTLYAPERTPGKQFDATPAAIRARFALGERMWQNPDRL